MLHLIDLAINTALLTCLLAAIPYALVDLIGAAARSQNSQQLTPVEPETTAAIPQTTSEQPKNRLRLTVDEKTAAEFEKMDPLA